jgi:large subunit ribosomal protein L9
VKVLLVEDVDKLGWLGDVVEVNNGYARNYLLPQGLAKAASEANIKGIAEEKAKRAEVRQANRKRLERAASAVDGAEAVIAARANEQGHLFGSVAGKDIAENLRAQGFTVADEIVQLHEHIKQTGSYPVKLRFADDLTATVSVTVVAEGAEPGTVQGSAETGETETASTEEAAPAAPQMEQEVDNPVRDEQVYGQDERQ